MKELTQVVNSNQIDYETIYFCDGINYILSNIVSKPKSVCYEFTPLIGQKISAQLKISSKYLFREKLFIYKKKINSSQGFFQPELWIVPQPTISLVS